VHISPSGRNGGGAAGDAGSSPQALYKYHRLAVNTPKKMCLLGYKIIFAWWAHIALRAEWRRGGRGCRFVTASAVQISSACGKRTKKDVPFGVQNNICLVGTYRPQSGGMAGDAGSSPRAPYKYHLHAVNAPKKICLLGYKIIFAWWAYISLRAEWRPVTHVRHRERHTNIIGLR
jgi:hypothetical protein